MSRIFCAVFCLVFAMSFCVPAFAGDAPKPTAPTEAEVKAMAEKMVGKFHLYATVKKESDQNVVDIYSLLLSQKRKSDPDAYMRELNALAVRIGETNIKNMKLLGLDEPVMQQHQQLGGLYQTAGNIEKACEHWQEGRDIALKLGFSAKAEEMNRKFAATCQKTP
jgi:hypothetical protein